MDICEDRDEYWMYRAISMAEKARNRGEVPVGAIVVANGVLQGEGWNCPIGLSDPTAHAEIQAIRDASVKIGNYRLVGCELYTTMEPCLMCVGAILHARLDRVVFGARDPKAGCVLSVHRLFEDPVLPYRVAFRGDVLAPICVELLQAFFRERRAILRNLSR